ncbi:MAG TPA: hypothetical protein VM686_21650, partial [Polyangiaceae bacterium]|nr:hypothetical protein [Polyangiaceae bacterium]
KSSAGANSGGGENAGTGSDDGGDGNSPSAGGVSAGGSGGWDPGAIGPDRLIVVGVSGVMIWNDAAALDADVVPDVLLSGEAAGARAVVVGDGRLAVVTDAQLVMFDGAAFLGSDSAPTALLDLPELSPSLGVARAAVDGEGDLWLTVDGSIVLYPAFGSLGSGDLPRATFFHEWGQIASMTYSAADDRLFAAQVSGAGILQLVSAKTESGDVELENQWSDASCWGTALADGVLYCAQNSGVDVWQDLSAAGPPSATLTAGLDSALEVDLVGDTLLVLDQSAGSVLLYKNASSLTSAAEPDARVEDVGLPVRARLSQTGSLYVLTTRYTDGVGSRVVMIYDDVFGSPKFRTELAANQGQDVWLLE